jgi:hypothetical protein
MQRKCVGGVRCAGGGGGIATGGDGVVVGVAFATAVAAAERAGKGLGGIFLFGCFVGWLGLVRVVGGGGLFVGW